MMYVYCVYIIIIHYFETKINCFAEESTKLEQLALEDFDTFLMSMDDQLEALHDEATKRNIALDLSTADFDRLEKLFDLMADGVSIDERNNLTVSFALRRLQIFSDSIQ